MGVKFSAYLWGIETQMTRREHTRVGQFSAYLWGIETESKSAMKSSGCCFQRTYEELKHELVSEYKWHCMGFQRTYEELKHFRTTRFFFSVPLFSAYLWGIETAHVTHDVVCSAVVFSVPMRNWNHILGRIWPRLAYVFSVPMRNWNLIPIATRFSYSQRFQRTYEELKQLHTMQ